VIRTTAASRPPEGSQLVGGLRPQQQESLGRTHRAGRFPSYLADHAVSVLVCLQTTVGSYPTVYLTAESAFADVLQVSLLDATVLHSTGGLFSVALFREPTARHDVRRAPTDVIRRFALTPKPRSGPRGVGSDLATGTSVSGLSSRYPEVRRTEGSPLRNPAL